VKPQKKIKPDITVPSGWMIRSLYSTEDDPGSPQEKWDELCGNSTPPLEAATWDDAYIDPGTSSDYQSEETKK
jgi:hypothetical protein